MHGDEKNQVEALSHPIPGPEKRECASSAARDWRLLDGCSSEGGTRTRRSLALITITRLRVSVFGATDAAAAAAHQEPSPLSNTNPGSWCFIHSLGSGTGNQRWEQHSLPHLPFSLIKTYEEATHDHAIVISFAVAHFLLESKRSADETRCGHQRQDWDARITSSTAVIRNPSRAQGSFAGHRNYVYTCNAITSGKLRI